MDDVHAELAMIAENLHRADLDRTERGKQEAPWVHLTQARLDEIKSEDNLQSGQVARIEIKRQGVAGLRRMTARWTGVNLPPGLTRAGQRVKRYHSSWMKNAGSWELFRVKKAARSLLMFKKPGRLWEPCRAAIPVLKRR